MVEKGEGAKALGVGVVFSFIGTMVSIAALLFIAPSLARIALRFSTWTPQQPRGSADPLRSGPTGS